MARGLTIKVHYFKKKNTNEQNLKIPLYSEYLSYIKSTSILFIVGKYWKQPKCLIRGT